MGFWWDIIPASPDELYLAPFPAFDSGQTKHLLEMQGQSGKHPMNEIPYAPLLFVCNRK